MITGVWYSSESSAFENAELSYIGGHFKLLLNSGEEIRGELSEVQVSDRVGSIPRSITMVDGGVFQTNNNDAIDLWLKQQVKRQVQAASIFHRLESSWHLIVFSAVFVIAFIVSLIYWGLPWASKELAYAVPAVVSESVGKNAFETLDDAFLQSTDLSVEQQQQITLRFNSKLSGLVEDDQGYDLHFRQIKDLPELANAFALPSGDIVVTDALVRILTPDQLDSVLLHEMGHVYHRHGMRRIIHDSSLTLIVMAVLGGDTTFAEELVFGIPVFLMNQHYSREAETEADEFAIKHMLETGVDPEEFAQALEKITEGEELSEGYSYLSSHPLTSERLNRARSHSEFVDN